MQELKDLLACIEQNFSDVAAPLRGVGIIASLLLSDLNPLEEILAAS